MAASVSLEKNEMAEKYEQTYRKCAEILPTLPRGRGWASEESFQYQGYWFREIFLKGIVLMQDHFRAKQTDIILAAPPKCGNTWLCTLMFVTMTRSEYDLSAHPLLNTGPRNCFPLLESYLLDDSGFHDLEALPSPRLLATHCPYALLSEQVRASVCKFVHIWRDPIDVFISLWYFTSKFRSKTLPPLSLDEAFELFCDGVSPFGPFWDHVLGYWKASLEMPDNVLMLRYEDFNKEPMFYLKRLAEFMGKPFTSEEEKGGVVERIVDLCSFENLSNLEVNKIGVRRLTKRLAIDNNNYFRKGEAGDYRNHLTDEMIERLDRITQEKFGGSGLI